MVSLQSQTEMQDLALTTDGDLAYTLGGDLDIEDAAVQNVRLLLLTTAGGFRDFPTLGVGAEESLGGKGSPALLRGRIQDAIRLDGGVPTTIEIVPAANGAVSVTVEATY